MFSLGSLLKFSSVGHYNSFRSRIRETNPIVESVQWSFSFTAVDSYLVKVVKFRKV